MGNYSSFFGHPDIQFHLLGGQQTDSFHNNAESHIGKFNIHQGVRGNRKEVPPRNVCRHSLFAALQVYIDTGVSDADTAELAETAAEILRELGLPPGGALAIARHVWTALGRSDRIEIIDRVFYPHSLGMFYTAMTQFIGFPKYGDEYKMMGLAAYGEPDLTEKLKEVLHLEDNGNFKLNLKSINLELTITI